jgi:hypothetical protein
MPTSGNNPPRKGPPKDMGPSIEEAITEAQGRQIDFPAEERGKYVRAMVKRVQELQAAGRTIEDITEQLPEFKRDFPYLFEMVTENHDFDAGCLKTMLTMLDRMGDGSMNHHQATVIVGKRLSDRYVKK